MISNVRRWNRVNYETIEIEIERNTALQHWNGGQKGKEKMCKVPQTTLRQMVEDETPKTEWRHE